MQAQYKSTADKAGGQKQDAAGPQKKGSGLKGLGFVAGQQALSTGGGGIPATWKVKKGDTLWEIAQNTLGDGSLWVQIWSANRSKTPNPHALSVGAVLQIPGGGPAAKKKKKTANTGGSYTVRSGDTLSKIAAKLLGDAGRWQELWQANQSLIPNPGSIKVGWVLTIPNKSTEPVPDVPEPDAPKPQEPAAPEPGPASTYTVKSGDSLSKIAAQLLGSAGRWQEIWNANRTLIPNPNALQVGMVLTIPGGTHQTPTPAQPDVALPAPGNDADMGPDHGGLAVGSTWLEQKMAGIYNSKGRYVHGQAQSLGIEPAVGAAVLSVESGGNGHVGGKLIIRFESHIFANLSGQSQWVNHSGSQSDEYAAFEAAKAKDENAAYESISMGAAQIMGFNAQRVGYSSARAMFDEFQVSLAAQLSGMFEFVRTSNVLHNAAKQKDWSTFAYYYNGSGYKANAYDTKMADAYSAYDKVTEGLPYA